MSELNRLIAGRINDAKITEAPVNRNVTGYGPKIPTRYMVRVGTRWHRVYVAQYGNSGSAYVRLEGKDFYLSNGVEEILEHMAKGETYMVARALMEQWRNDVHKAEEGL
jgi:hypothetical protein